MDLFDEQHYESPIVPDPYLQGKDLAILETPNEVVAVPSENNQDVHRNLRCGEPCENEGDKATGHDGDKTALFSNMDALHGLDMDDFLEED